MQKTATTTNSKPESFQAYRTPKAFLDWLDQSEVATTDVLDWCYFAFGRGRGSEEPHLQLLAALPAGDAYPRRKRLAARITTILRQSPDLTFPYPGYDTAPESLLYDLLSLGGRLNCPEELFEPLWDIYQTLREKGRQLPPLARMALTKALIHNQGFYHPPLMAVWLDMTDGKRDAVLSGTLETGLEGIGMMPGVEDEEKPDRMAVGQGLLNLARHYAGDVRTRRQRFRAQVIWLKELWQLKPEYFIKLAHHLEWVQKGHSWAVDALPDMCISNFGDVSNTGEVALVPVRFVDCLKKLGNVQVKAELCAGQLVQIQFSAHVSPRVNAVCGQIQGIANIKPEISEHEFYEYVEQIIGRVNQSVELGKKETGLQKPEPIAAGRPVRAKRTTRSRPRSPA